MPNSRRQPEEAAPTGESCNVSITLFGIIKRREKKMVFMLVARERTGAQKIEKGESKPQM